MPVGEVISNPLASGLYIFPGRGARRYRQRKAEFFLANFLNNSDVFGKDMMGGLLILYLIFQGFTHPLSNCLNQDKISVR